MRASATPHVRPTSSKRKKSRGDSPSRTSAQALSRNSSIDHYSSQRKARNRKGRVKVFLIVVVAILLAAAGGAFAYMQHINSNLNSGVTNDLLEQLTTTEAGEPFYMLLLGVDKDEDRASGSEYGNDFSAYRTDTIILSRIDPKNKKVTLISIPRDTYVDLGEHGKQKINSAYSIGGAPYTVQVVSDFAGVNISHYAEIDMDGFAAVVNAVGGVDVDLPVAVSDPDYTEIDLPAGPQHLDGQTAALLGRCRHGYDQYGGGDFYRAANQRMLIGAVLKKVMSSDPVTLASTISTLTSYVTCDMPATDIIGLASNFAGIDVDNDVYSALCPTISKYVNNLWYEVCDTTSWQKIMSRVDQGLSPYEGESEDPTAGVAGSVGASGTGTQAQTSDSTGNADNNVLVLNAAGIDGMAGSIATTLKNYGYTATADTASSTQSQSVVIYNGDANKSLADEVAGKLGLSSKSNDGSYSNAHGVIVYLGTDQAS